MEELESGDIAVKCSFCARQEDIIIEREKSLQGQKRAAEKIVEASNKKFCSMAVGTSVVLQVPKVDRGPLDPQNILRKILNVRNGVYQIGTSAGIIKSWFPRAEFSESDATMKEEVPEKQITLIKFSTKKKIQAKLF